MTRKKKGNTNIPNKPNNTSRVFNSKPVEDAVKKLQASFPDIKEIKFNESIYKKLLESIGTIHKGELQEWLKSFAEVTQELIDYKQKLESEGISFNEKLEKTQQEQAILSNDKLEIGIERENFEIKQEEIGSRAASLVDREREIEIKELAAKTGFLDINEKALTELRAEIDALEKNRETVKKQILKFNQHLDQKQAAYEQELVERESKLLQQKQLQAKKEIRLQRQEQELEDDQQYIRQEIEEDFQAKIDQLENQVQRKEADKKKAFEEIDSLHEEIDNFQDLQQVLKGRSPEGIIIELESIKQENKSLQEQLSGSDIDYLNQENTQQKERVSTLNSRLHEVEAELEATKSELSRRRLGVADQQRLAAENLALEKHKTVLTVRLNDLSSTIDHLTDAQQAESAFPSLSLIDSTDKFNREAFPEAIPELKTFAKELQHRIAQAEKETKLYFSLPDIQLLLGGLAMSQLHVFNGISGTGKTSLVKAFAKAMGGHCTDISVQAGWRDRDDLLGYYNAFEKRFYEKECLQGLYQAQTEQYHDLCNVILLDEMNLSRPEQYFADFLSAIEKNNPTERLIDLSTFSMPNAPKHFKEGRKIIVPKNVWFMGTANHDETTNELADKTYDRSHIMNLPRQDEKFTIQDYDTVQYSYSSLRKKFDEAQNKYADNVTNLLTELTTSKLTSELENRFGIGWGNRFERQAKEFIPVIMATGGSEAFALDHLLETRVFRDGKVTGRYDATVEDLSSIETELKKIWQAMKWKDKPKKSLQLIAKDRRRKERGG